MKTNEPVGGAGPVGAPRDAVPVTGGVNGAPGVGDPEEEATGVAVGSGRRWEEK